MVRRHRKLWQKQIFLHLYSNKCQLVESVLHAGKRVRGPTLLHDVVCEHLCAVLKISLSLSVLIDNDYIRKA